MSRVEVRPVGSKRDQTHFVNWPWQHYARDPNWVPPLIGNLKEMVGFRPHPFYQQADAQAFLAYRDGSVAGRIVALVNHAHNERYGEKRGFWGFFESVDDSNVSRALFEAAREWCAGQGMESMRGPCNPSLNHECGLLVDGFDSRPVFMMTYNPPYYERLVEEAGYEKSQDLYAYWGHVDMLGKLDKKMAFIVAESERRFNVNLRRLDRSRFAQDVRSFLEIYNQSLIATWGFVPLSDAELDHVAGSLKHLIVPEMTSIAEVDGQPIGAMFGLLDYSGRLQKANGRLFPFGFFHLLRNRRAITRIRLISTNVIPEYQKWGIGLVLLARLIPDILSWGVKDAEFSWVLESNHLSRSTLERAGTKRYKTYRIYDRAV